MSELLLELDDLVGAEDFLNYFGIEFDQSVVHVNRLHILQRFHDYLSKEALPDTVEAQTDLYRRLLSKAYQDFVESDALTEKVFKVLKVQGQPQETFIPLENVFKGSSS